MASTIKGITVKIAGDTMDLQKSLKAVQSSSASLQSELSAINRQLKFDPDNTVLLAQKQEVLQEQITKSQSALSRLLEVQDQIEVKAKNGEISTEQYRAYQREVEKAKSKLETFTKQLAETEEKANAINLESARNEMSKTETSVDKTGDSFKELENKSDKTDLSKVKKEMDEVKSSADNLKSAVGGAVKDAVAAAAAVGGAVTGAIASATGEQKALNSLQAQTGLTTSELEKYENVIKDIYKDNFGESQEDVANTLAKIKQVTNEQNPEKLKDMAENLYTLEDTFDNFDISETLRGINGLMTNMGLTADEAFDYVVLGAQNGLNYSGELGDNIAEYSQIWGQAGFDAEQMFSILENGTKNGAYNLDKVNDFVKEFTISLSDGRIEENLDSFSTGTGEIFKEWKNGKATASDVFYSVISDLKNTSNEQEALTTASTVWSSLGEDNAMKVIKSLGNVNTSYKNVKGSMEKVKDIKYDDVEADWASLGRTVQTDVINPIGKSLFPEVKKLCTFASKHTKDIIPTLKIVGSLVGGIWVGKKTTAVASGVQSLIGAYKSLRTATETAKIAQEGLNLAQKSNAIGIVVGLAATLAGTIWSLATASDEATESQDELNEAHEKAQEEIKELQDANDEYVQSKKDATSEVESEFQYYDDLWGELQGIVDQNGKVKKGYEDRAKFITNELSEVTGKEIEWNGNVITSYSDLKDIIDDTLESKKALAMLSATEDAYQTAVSGLASAKTDSANQYVVVKNAKNDNELAQMQLNQLQTFDNDNLNAALYAYQKGKISKKEYSRIYDYLKNNNGDYDAMRVMLGANTEDYANALKNAKSKAKETETNLKKAEDKYKTYQDKIVQYNTTIQNVENLTAVTATGNTEKIDAAMSDLTNNIITYTTGNKETLEQQVNDFKTNAENLRTAYKDGVEGITKDQVAEAEELQERAEIELAKYNDMYGTAAAIASGKASEINESQKKITDGFVTAETGSKESLENQVTNFTANYELLKTAMDENQPGVTQKMVDNAKELVDKATNELDTFKGKAEPKGKAGTNAYADGIKDEKALANVEESAKELPKSAEKGTKSSYSKGHTGGYNFSYGYWDGMKNFHEEVQRQAEELATTGMVTLQKTQDSHSPSKKTRKLGEYFGEGYRLGIADEIAETQKTVRSLTSRALSAVEGDPVGVINGKFTGIRTQSQNAAANSQMSKIVTNSPTIELKLTGDVIINNDMDVDEFNRRVSTAIVQTLDGEAARWGG